MSAERVRSARWFKRWALFALFMATACMVNLGDDDTVAETSPRYIDELCSTQAYTLQGNAVRTSGITSDTCGFVLGPGPGSVTFDITPESEFDSYAVSALVTRNGHTAWETIGSNSPPSSIGAEVPPNSGGETVSTDADEVFVLDVRLRGVYSPANCD